MRDARKPTRSPLRFLPNCTFRSPVNEVKTNSWQSLSSCKLKNQNSFRTKPKLSNSETFERSQGASYRNAPSWSNATSSCVTFWLQCKDYKSSVATFQPDWDNIRSSRPSRPRVTTSREDRRIRLLHLRNRFVPAKNHPTNFQELAQALTEEWDIIPANVIRRYIGSMRRRCNAVIQANDGHTRY